VPGFNIVSRGPLEANNNIHADKVDRKDAPGYTLPAPQHQGLETNSGLTIGKGSTGNSFHDNSSLQVCTASNNVSELCESVKDQDHQENASLAPFPPNSDINAPANLFYRDFADVPGTKNSSNETPQMGTARIAIRSSFTPIFARLRRSASAQTPISLSQLIDGEIMNGVAQTSSVTRLESKSMRQESPIHNTNMEISNGLPCDPSRRGIAKSTSFLVPCSKPIALPESSNEKLGQVVSVPIKVELIKPASIIARDRSESCSIPHSVSNSRQGFNDPSFIPAPSLNGAAQQSSSDSVVPPSGTSVVDRRINDENVRKDQISQIDSSSSSMGAETSTTALPETSEKNASKLTAPSLASNPDAERNQKSAGAGMYTENINGKCNENHNQFNFDQCSTATANPIAPIGKAPNQTDTATVSSTALNRESLPCIATKSIGLANNDSTPQILVENLSIRHQPQIQVTTEADDNNTEIKPNIPGKSNVGIANSFSQVSYVGDEVPLINSEAPVADNLNYVANASIMASLPRPPLEVDRIISQNHGVLPKIGAVDLSPFSQIDNGRLTPGQYLENRRRASIKYVQKNILAIQSPSFFGEMYASTEYLNQTLGRNLLPKIRIQKPTPPSSYQNLDIFNIIDTSELSNDEVPDSELKPSQSEVAPRKRVGTAGARRTFLLLVKAFFDTSVLFLPGVCTAVS
jgi:hypothetical protein